MREDGWVALSDLNSQVGEISRADLEVLVGRDEKERLLLSTEGEAWVAAVSGHSISGVVGPGRELSPAEVPALLVHGSYAQYTNAIYRSGLQARRAIHLLKVDVEGTRTQILAHVQTYIHAGIHTYLYAYKHGHMCAGMHSRVIARRTAVLHRCIHAYRHNRQAGKSADMHKYLQQRSPQP